MRRRKKKRRDVASQTINILRRLRPHLLPVQSSIRPEGR